MKDFKEYEEYEVWVNPYNNYTDNKNMVYPTYMEAGNMKYIKAKLLIPKPIEEDEVCPTCDTVLYKAIKPERKVTITEGELRARMSIGVEWDKEYLDSIIEEIFGRGDD